MPVTNNATGAKPGDWKYWPSATVPAGWIKCNGAAVSRTAYAALFNVIGTTYGAGDGATTFNLPDFRGEFIRGLDDGRGVDSGRLIGTGQSDMFKSHFHNGPTLRSDIGGGAGPGGGGVAWGVNADASGGSETRPRNVAQLAIMKY